MPLPWLENVQGRRGIPRNGVHARAVEARRRVTIGDVAVQAGVSVATVSKLLNAGASEPMPGEPVLRRIESAG